MLFLNKCDLLKKKLAAGIKVNKHVTSYGSRPNDYENVSKCECVVDVVCPDRFFLVGVFFFVWERRGVAAHTFRPGASLNG